MSLGLREFGCMIVPLLVIGGLSWLVAAQVRYLSGPPRAPLPPPPMPTGPAGPDAFFVSRGGAQAGPYTLDRLCQLMREGHVRPDDYVWAEGLDDWRRAHEIVVRP